MDGWSAQCPEDLQGTENEDDGDRDECNGEDRKNGKLKMLKQTNKQTNICNMIRTPKKRKKERKKGMG